MPLSIYPKLREQLISFLKEQLPKLVVQNRHLEYGSTMCLKEGDEIILECKVLKDELDKIFYEEPFFQFTTDHIERTLGRMEKFSPDAADVPLCTLEAFHDIPSAAANIIEAFEALPFRYAHTFELPKALGDQFSDFLCPAELSPEVRLLSGDQIVSQFPVDIENSGLHQENTLLGLLFQHQGPRWSNASVYFHVETEGYVNQYGTSKTTIDTETRLREFFGLGLALFLFDLGIAGLLTSMLGEIGSTINVHKQNDRGRVFDTKIPASKEITQFISRIEFYRGGSLKNENQHLRWIQHNLTKVTQCFTNQSKAERVLLASRWLFDSHLGQNELLSFVQTMVALEIMLGEKKRSDRGGSLNELLSNRCAYLIGKSQTQRDELLGDFSKIYKVRSQIVHSGHSRLSSSERDQFCKLRWMCKRVIQEEIELLSKDLQQRG
jgi:hypothetical protein